MTHIKRIDESWGNSDSVFAELVSDRKLSVMVEDGTLESDYRNRGVDKSFEYSPNEIVDFVDFMSNCADIAETTNGYYTVEGDDYNKRYTVRFYTYDIGEGDGDTEIEIGNIVFHVVYFDDDFDIQEVLVENGTIER